MTTPLDNARRIAGSGFDDSTTLDDFDIGDLRFLVRHIAEVEARADALQRRFADANVALGRAEGVAAAARDAMAAERARREAADAGAAAMREALAGGAYDVSMPGCVRGDVDLCCGDDAETVRNIIARRSLGLVPGLHAMDEPPAESAAPPSADGHPLGTILRYGQGETALMRVDTRVGKGWRARYFGRQCLGGAVGADHAEVSVPSVDDLRTWFKHNPPTGDEQAAPPEPDDLLDEADLHVETFGGGFDRTANGVRITHRPTGLTVTADAERSQHKNRAAAPPSCEGARAYLRGTSRHDSDVIAGFALPDGSEVNVRVGDFRALLRERDALAARTRDVEAALALAPAFRLGDCLLLARNGHPAAPAGAWSLSTRFALEYGDLDRMLRIAARYAADDDQIAALRRALAPAEAKAEGDGRGGET